MLALGGRMPASELVCNGDLSVGSFVFCCRGKVRENVARVRRLW